MLKLTEYKFIESDVPVTCEAGEYLWAYVNRQSNYYGSMDVIVAMQKSVDITIPKGEKHLLMIFVTPDGEMVEVHCRTFVNKIMVKRELYPPVILNAIKEFKNKHQ